MANGIDKVWPLNVIVPTIDRMSFIWNNFSLYRTPESQVSISTSYVVVCCHVTIGTRQLYTVTMELIPVARGGC